jgi:uncharacterized protein (DUF1778 family)
MSKQQRIQIRVTDAQREVIQNAAAMIGITVTDFITLAAMEKARDIADQDEQIELTMEGANKMLDMMESPPLVSDRLLQAAKGRKATHLDAMVEASLDGLQAVADGKADVKFSGPY